ncbi:hypothetical protein [Microcoleus sp. FACHB-831]|nr:hypothetical protein [Microcoleus sp. FACHB-831]
MVILIFRGWLPKLFSQMRSLLTNVVVEGAIAFLFYPQINADYRR